MRLVFYFTGWWKSTALICLEGCERVLAKPSSWLTGSHLMCHHTLFLVSVCWYFLLMRTPVILHQSSQGWPQFNMIPSAENLPPIRSQFQKQSKIQPREEYSSFVILLWHNTLAQSNLRKTGIMWLICSGHTFYHWECQGRNFKQNS